MEAKALAALVPAMAQAQKELAADLAGWYQKLGPNAASLKYTPAHLRQIQVLLGIAEAKAQTIHKGYPYASFPMVAAQAVLNTMNQQMPQKLAAQTLESQLTALSAKFEGLPSPQLIHAAALAKGDKLVLSKHQSSANRYAGQVLTDLKFQFGVGLAKGETIQQLTKRIAGLSGFQKAVDASHPAHAGSAVAGALTKRYHNWAQRLVRTELTHSYNAVAMAGIQAAHKVDDRVVAVWDATNDLRVCLQCKALHGKQVTPGGLYQGGIPHPPAHPNCRCAVVSWIDDDGWDDDETIPYVPSHEEVMAEQALLQKQQDELARREAATQAAKAVAKEDLDAYDAHKIKLAAEKAAAEQAALEAKLKKEEAEYQAMLAAQKAAALKAQQEAEAAAKKAIAKQKAAELKAKKAALAALKPAEFDPATSPHMKSFWKGKKAGQEAIIGKGGFALKDKDTIIGHGYEFKWDGKLGEWQFQKGPDGFTYSHQKKAWIPLKPIEPVPPPPPPKPAAPTTPQPMDIKGYEWKAVGDKWVLHKGGVPASQLVPKHQHGVHHDLADKYALGQQLADKGLVTTGLGVMEGHGYIFQKKGDYWVKTHFLGTNVEVPSYTPSVPSTPPPATWTPPKIELAPNRKGVHSFDAHPSSEYKGLHGKAFEMDGDVVEGHSVRAVKVKGADGEDYYECVFKMTHAYTNALATYAPGSPSSWMFRERSVVGGVLKDKSGKENNPTSTIKRRMKVEGGTTTEIGSGGAMQNVVRIRAKNLKELDEAMDRLSKHVGADLRKKPEQADRELANKARLCSKFDPQSFGPAMNRATTPELQRQVIEDHWARLSKAHPIMQKALADMQTVEVFPGHVAGYSKTLGKHIAETYPSLYSTSQAPADIAALVAENGMLASSKRFNSGIFTTGMSTERDFETGGADGVFIRVSKQREEADSWSNFTVIYDTEKVLGRTDWWGFNFDNYGRSGYDSYGSRWSVPGMKRGDAESGNEVMPMYGVPTSAIKKLVCKDRTFRDSVLEKLRKKGITKVNGVPIEEFVTSR